MTTKSEYRTEGTGEKNGVEGWRAYRFLASTEIDVVAAARLEVQLWLRRRR
jgi:hypothetical protein